jgi:hypothetical protein
VRRRILLLAAAVSIAAAVPVAASADAPWKRHRAAGFSIALPSTWADAGKQRGAILAEAKRLSRSEPELAALLNRLLAAGSRDLAVKMIAFDLAGSSLRSGFATNLNVVREETDLTLAAWSAAALRSLTSLSFIRKPVWSRKMRLPAGRAIRISYKARYRLGSAGTLDVSILQFGLVRNGAAYIFTYTTLPKLSARYRPVFERSARSLRWG